MRTILNLFYLFNIIVLLAACSIQLGDDGSATQSAQIYADAKVRVASEERLAKEAEADARKVEAQERTAASANTLPIVILLIGATAILGMYVYWQGKIIYERTAAESGYMQVAGRPRYLSLEPPHNPVRQIPGAVQRAADARGGYPEFIQGRWVIVNEFGRIIARQKLLAAHIHGLEDEAIP